MAPIADAALSSTKRPASTPVCALPSICAWYFETCARALGIAAAIFGSSSAIAFTSPCRSAFFTSFIRSRAGSQMFRSGIFAASSP
jgi:hypothetical protein